ncbi:unnamed protein product [Polarella glacialis]|uniref:Uncharacterized protein n=1 Tax=Polarella glacialis TaxID=89957 RepID=A0A813K2Z4_POLGL|nr:unnamed protein product [Polarella glacialis]
MCQGVAQASSRSVRSDVLFKIATNNRKHAASAPGVQSWDESLEAVQSAEETTLAKREELCQAFGITEHRRLFKGVCEIQTWMAQLPDYFGVIQAPYFTGAQLAHFAEQGIVQCVFGPPGLLLYSIPRVVIHMDFHQISFDWVDLECVLNKWSLRKDQFVDACMLAGTEYCLTYPYLNLGNTNNRFDYDAAVHIIKQAPLINWMQTFPTEDMKADHIDGYCICKVLVQSSPILHVGDNTIRPLGPTFGNNSPLQVPSDFEQIMGEQLPMNLYYLMLNGVISHKMPQALAKGEWMDKSQPLVDTAEFRNLIVELGDYRQRALGLIARHLHGSFLTKQIVCKAFWEPHHGRNAKGQQVAHRVLVPEKLTNCLRWKISADAVAAELERQGIEKVDFKFCLRWHAHEFHNDGKLIKDITGANRLKDELPDRVDKKSLAATVHFMLLEHLELIADDGGMTVLGDVLKDTATEIQGPCLVAMEMMKFGILSGEPFEPAQSDRPFPEKVKYPKSPTDVRTKSVLLLSRVMSLVPMRLRNDMWNADVDFDLAAFHALVRLVKRALRQLVEASLSSVLLRDLSNVKLLPPGFMCASPKTKEEPFSSPAIMPTFMLPRACMGIVCLFFLKYQGEPRHFARELTLRFPCCHQPLEDLKGAFLFWEDLKRCVNEIAEPLGAEELAADMKAASEILVRQQQKLGIFPEQVPNGGVLKIA